MSAGLQHLNEAVALLLLKVEGIESQLAPRTRKETRPRVAQEPAHMAQCEVIEYLRRQVFEDAVAAGWLKPCARSKPNGKATVFYNFAEVHDVSLRIAAGEYPQLEAGRARA